MTAHPIDTSRDGNCNDSRCERTKRGEIHSAHSLQDQDQKTVERLKNLPGLGSSLTGGTAGAAIGLIVGGPAGAVIGGAAGTLIGHVLKKVGDDYAVRFLSPNEQMRIGGVIIYTMNKIEENLNEGFKLRQDDFFKERVGERSSAKEIVEGILLAAQREHEEKKLPFYGNLLANIAFTQEINRVHGNLLIKLGQGLSYYQLCLLSLFAQKNSFKLRKGDYRGTTNIGLDKIPLLQESVELARLELINIPGDAVLGLTDINPAGMNINGEGRILFQLMELSKIDSQELASLALLFE